MGWFYTYRSSTPKAGGVKSQTRRGKFGQTWLGKEWIGTIEGKGDEQRLSRGRAYARHGNVKSITIKPGIIKARVHGSWGTYSVQIELPPLALQVCESIVEMLAQSIVVSSQLMSGHAPVEVQEIFSMVGEPVLLKEALKTSCSCPDAANPCKHIAAVFYLMADEIDRDPFQFLSFRGLARDTFVKALQQGTESSNAKEAKKKKQQVKKVASKDAQKKQQELSLENFWSGQPTTVCMPHNKEPKVAAALIKQLGSIPLWKGNNPFVKEMEEVYTKASSYALELATKGLIQADVRD
jgi:uncharacterized Zn finger protein